MVNVSEELSVVGLFAGVGGLELGLELAGHETLLLCELMPHARAVLSAAGKRDDDYRAFVHAALAEDVTSSKLGGCSARSVRPSHGWVSMPGSQPSWQGRRHQR